MAKWLSSYKKEMVANVQINLVKDMNYIIDSIGLVIWQTGLFNFSMGTGLGGGKLSIQTSSRPGKGRAPPGYSFLSHVT